MFAYLSTARELWGNVGLSIAIVVGNDTVMLDGFGHRRHGDPAPVTADTLFQIGSTTKAFAATSIAMLVERGQLHWDDPLKHYLPDFTLRDPNLAETLTLRDAVAHRSGIGDTNLYPFMSAMPIDAVAQLAHIDPVWPFRASFCYNNLLYAALGEVVRRVTEMSWPKFVTHALLTPLGMTRTFASFEGLWSPGEVAPVFLGDVEATDLAAVRPSIADWAMPHIWHGRGPAMQVPWQCYDNAPAAGSISSCAADLAKWLSFNLSGGVSQGTRLITRAALQDLYATQNSYIDYVQAPLSAETYASGWRRGSYRDVTVISHGGGIIGFPAYIAMIPSHDIGIAILSNGAAHAPERLGSHKFGLHRALAFWAFDHFLGAPEYDWSGEFLARAVDAEMEWREQNQGNRPA